MQAEDYPEEYLIGVRLFNQEDFFEAHEAWEEAWRGTPMPDRLFYKGLIHVAVALCHYHNGNLHGARKLSQSGRAYLERFCPRWMGLDVEGFLTACERCFAPAREALSAPPLASGDSRIPRLELQPPPDAWPVIPAWVYDEENA